MRISTVHTIAVFSVFFFGVGAVLVAQPGGGQRGGGPQGIQYQQYQGAPEQQMRGMQGGGPGQMQGGGPQRMMMQGGPPGGGQRPQWGGPQGQMQPPPWAQGGQPTAPGGRGGPPQQAGQASPDQVTRTIARLRAMDANQNGVLEANEIPVNQRDRVNTWVTQLGGNPGSGSFNLASLERRAMATAGGVQSDRQQQGGDRQQQQRQQQQTTAPLVPTFGEQVTAEASPLGFGQRDREAQTAAATTRQGGRQQGTANQQQQSSVPRPATVKVSTPYDNLPAGLRDNPEFRWFFEADVGDGRVNPATGQEGPPDGQLSMQEFVNGLGGGEWSEGIVLEFVGFWDELDGNKIWVNGLDRDGDGFVTMDEALVTVKERTELKERQEKTVAQQMSPSSRQQRGQQGGQSPAALMSDRGPQGNPTQGRQPQTATGNQGAPQGQMQSGQQSGPGGRGSGGRSSGGQSPRGGRGGGQER